MYKNLGKSQVVHHAMCNMKWEQNVHLRLNRERHNLISITERQQYSLLFIMA